MIPDGHEAELAAGTEEKVAGPARRSATRAAPRDAATAAAGECMHGWRLVALPVAHVVSVQPSGASRGGRPPRQPWAELGDDVPSDVAGGETVGRSGVLGGFGSAIGFGGFGVAEIGGFGSAIGFGGFGVAETGFDTAATPEGAAGSPGRGKNVLDSGDDTAVLIRLILASPPQRRQTDCAPATPSWPAEPTSVTAIGGAIIDER